MNMLNLQAYDVLRQLLDGGADNQRQLAGESGNSLGIVNRSLRLLAEEGYIGEGYVPTEKARRLAEEGRTRRAVILAAGYGMRMIPINQETPKGLIEVRGEPIIEHTIRQLQEAGITEIYVVAGFMKERYEYLIDRFGVTLLFCWDYPTKNNLYSLACAAAYLADAYIVPCDVYCYSNPFRPYEFYSWYMLSRGETKETDVRATRTREIAYLQEGDTGNAVIGIAYLTAEDAAAARERLLQMTAEGKNSLAYWEAVISEKKRMTVSARLVDPKDVVEINTYEQLRELDYYNSQLRNDVTEAIQKAFNARFEEIENITVLKKGLTNRSFLFTLRGQRYIMRIPGEGTEAFIDRSAEAEVYELLRGRGICDDNVYFDAEKGFKIARYIENARVCRDTDPEEVAECLQIARRFHELKLKGRGELKLFEILDYYEGLWESGCSQYRDYGEIKGRILAMRPFVEAHAREAVLSHLDCNPDNFLISVGPDGKKKIDLIDWEYAAMHDPLADLAGFITYRMHDEPKRYADMVIDGYFPEGCDTETRLLVYCYVAMWGLYNSNWCEYKTQLGVELGDFAITEYRYAKIFSRIFEEEYQKYLREKENP
jgi:CTP:phosphocholine cytidylyltransferase-like protein/thiamine kinase-like enzyme